MTNFEKYKFILNLEKLISVFPYDDLPYIQKQTLSISKKAEHLIMNKLYSNYLNRCHSVCHV